MKRLIAILCILTLVYAILPRAYAEDGQGRMWEEDTTEYED